MYEEFENKLRLNIISFPLSNFVFLLILNFRQKNRLHFIKTIVQRKMLKVEKK